jgi:putative ABC transport system permease protein
MIWQERNIFGTFIGTTSDYFAVENGSLQKGRFFTAEEEDTLAKMAVIGSKIKEDLFNNQDPIGQHFKIKKENFEVIGVMEEQGMSGFTNKDTLVVVPIKTAQKLLLGINHVSFVRVKINEADNIPSAVEDIKATLRDQHNIRPGEEDDFTIRSQAEMLKSFTSITDSVKLFLVAIAAVSLLVGGIGIMNIMLVSVAERTHEVGLRMAVGAKKADILGQFILESIVITFLGGLIGIALGAGLSGTIALIVNYLKYDWSYVVSWGSVVIAVGVSILVGLVFGVYPAREAADLDPVEALRYE